MDAPLIFTSLGNLPVDSLEYQPSWDDQPGYIVFREKYLLNGEIVRENSHAYSKRGVLAEGFAGTIGG